ncbi:TPA: hypothetical protein P0E36_004922 [Vibrio harveyi]|nr:hypothetical protein [Vibrio harveyi]
MFARLLRDNPLGLLIFCASLIGTGQLISYQLVEMKAKDEEITSQLAQISIDISAFERSVTGNVAELKNDVQRNVFALDSKFTDRVNDTERRFTDRVNELQVRVAKVETENKTKVD